MAIINFKGEYMQTLRFFHVKFSGPTNKRGPRVLIHDLRFNKRRSIPADNGSRWIADTAAAWLADKWINVEFVGEKSGAEFILGTTDLINQI